MTDIEPGMLVQSRWYHPAVGTGLVVAVCWATETADVIWAGRSRPIPVKLKFLIPLREEPDV